MKIISDTLEFRTQIQALLAAVGLSSFSEADLCRDTKVVRDDIYADTLAHGGKIEDPFFNFVVLNGIAIFTFFEDPFLIYAFPCKEAELIRTCESRFSMEEVEPCKQYLRKVFDKNSADIAVSRVIAESWMETR